MQTGAWSTLRTTNFSKHHNTMDLPTIKLTQKEFDALPVTTSGAYDQDSCKYLSQGQWVYINRKARKYKCALIHITSPALSTFGRGKTADIKVDEVGKYPKEMTAAECLESQEQHGMGEAYKSGTKSFMQVEEPPKAPYKPQKFNDPDKFCVDATKNIRYGDIKARRLAVKNSRRAAHGLPPIKDYGNI